MGLGGGGSHTILGFTSGNPTKFSQWRSKKDPLMALAGGGKGNHVKYAQSILHNKCQLLKGEEFAKAYPSWGKGIPPNTATPKFSWIMYQGKGRGT